MAKVRGSAIMFVMAMAVAMVCLIGMVSANTFTVGGSRGWTFKVADWPAEKSFKAGDTLVFSYAKGQHNVAVVNKEGYDSCKLLPTGAQVFESGNDQIELAKGDSYFICTFTGHCQGGMKIAITAN